MNTSTYDCKRCGAAFGITGSGTDDDAIAADEHFAELVEWHESGHCAPIARSAIERARLLVDLQWDDEDADVPEDATATALLALAEEQRTANLIAVLALPSAVKNKVVTDAKSRLLIDVVSRLGLDAA